jgi:hypothetical protein
MQQLSLFESPKPLTLETIQQLFADSYRELRLGQLPPSFDVKFYPFVGVNHTIRSRRGELQVRLSDLFVDASRQVLKAISIILLCKLYRRRVHPQAAAIYKEYVDSAAMKAKAQSTRSQRGRKLISDPKGQSVDLSSLFQKLNEKYFQNQLEKLNLGWGPKKSRRILGHYDPSHHAISISRWFDSPKIPEHVVAYILYHEMLHALFAKSSNFDLRNKHSCQFKNEEKRFEQFQEANDWIKKNL